MTMLLKSTYFWLSLLLNTINCQQVGPSVLLYNAAVPNTRMPVIGLGTGAYCVETAECWSNQTAYNLAINWYNIGGRRYDSAHGYPTQFGIADALLNLTQNYTKIPRSDIFITSKIGWNDGSQLGYNDALTQFAQVLNVWKVDFVDLLLIHWPSSQRNNSMDSTDSYCNRGDINNFNASFCRQQTWKALIKIFTDGGARAIGVSNFDQNQLNDIFALNSLIPAVNQFEF
eukprot:433777_1